MVSLEVFAYNAAARRLYERVGFIHEGTLLHALYRDGAFHVVHRMAILREDATRLRSGG